MALRNNVAIIEQNGKEVKMKHANSVFCGHIFMFVVFVVLLSH